MKSARQLLTISFVLLFSACTKDSIDVGSTAGAGGNTTVEGASGGTTTASSGAGGTGILGTGGDGGLGTGGVGIVGTGGVGIPGTGGGIVGTGGVGIPGTGGGIPGTGGGIPGTGGVGIPGTGGVGIPGSGGVGGLGSGGVGGPGSGGVGGLGSGGVGGVGGQAGAPGTGSSCAGPNIVARDINNYTIATSLALAPIRVKAATDLTFDWSGATADLGGRAVAPATDIVRVDIIAFDLSLTSLQNKLNTDSIVARDLLMGAPLTYFPKGGKLAARLSELSIGNEPISSGTIISLAAVLEYFDPVKYPPESTSYLMVVNPGTMFLDDILMMQAFQPDTAASNTIVAMRPDSTTFNSSANLRSLTPIGVPAGQAALTLDFGQAISRTGLGDAWDSSAIASAFIGHYSQNLSELEAGMFNLDRLATDYFRADDYRTEITDPPTVDFAALTTAAGKRFTGIDSTGTWLVGLRCSMCRNPAPWFVTILKPCGTP